MTMPPASKPPPNAKAGKPRRTWFAHLGVWTLRLLVVSAVALAIITQSGVLRWLILPRIESAVGCVAEAGHVSITPGGEIAIRNLRLSVPSIPGTAGTFLEVKRLEIVPRWSGLFTGAIPIDAMRAQEPIFRLSQDKDFNLNIMALSGSAGVGPMSFVPAVEIRDALLDFGEHDADGYTQLISLRVAGTLARATPASSRYTLELRHIPPANNTPANMDALRVSGEFDLALRTGTIELDNIDLARWQRVAVPSRVSELWGRMAVSGEVRNTKFSFTPKEGPVVSFSLKDVSLNVPVPADTAGREEPAQPDAAARASSPLLGMRHVTGDLRFERGGLHALLRGLIEDLPCLVRLDTEGYTPDSPLTCHIVADRFIVEQQPRLLPFAPWYVKRNFARFSGPTAEVDAEVTLRRRRSEGPLPAPLEVNGRFNFEKGAAAFEKFAYPFHDMKGTITFSDREVRIDGITGVGPTGAKMLATGMIAPPNDLGSVSVDVTVADVPVDSVLREAVPPHRRDLVDHLFCEAEYARLVEAGMIRSPASPADSAAAPFTLGGQCTIRVLVQREPGEHSEYRTTINVAMDRAGLLALRVPYPLIGRNVTLRITDEDLVLRATRLTGPRGGQFTLAADVILGEGDTDDQYDIRVTAANVPLDDLLVQSIPDHPIGSDAPERAAQSPRAFVRALGLAGIADGEGRVRSTPGGSTAYEIRASFAGISSHIGGRGCLELNALSGDIVLSDEDSHALNLSGNLGEGRFHANLAADRQPGRDAAVTASVGFERFPIDEPVEELVTIVEPSQGRRLAELRHEYRPAGRVSGTLDLSPAREGTNFNIRFTRIEDASFALLGGRLSSNDATGDIAVDPGFVRGTDFSTQLRFNDEPVGTLRLNGNWPITPAGAGEMRLTLTESDLGSPLVRAMTREFSPRAAHWLEELNVKGNFTLDAAARRSQGATTIEGEIQPTSLAVSRRGAEARIDRVSGRIRFGAAGGEVSSLSAHTDRWSFAADGRWSTSPSLDVDLLLDFQSDGFPADLLIFFPPAATKSLADARLEVNGPLALRDARLRSTPDGASLRLTTRADCGPASFNPGLRVDIESAQANIDVLWPIEGASPPTISTTLDVPRFTLEGITLTDGHAVIRAGDRPGAYDLPSVSAALHGGTISASAILDTRDPRSESSPASYSTEIRMARVDFASLLSELRFARDAAPASAPTGARGTIDATLTIAGTLGQTDSRRGRGLARISGGEVLALPGAMALLRLSNLQPPMGEPLESAVSSFFMRGNLITFERLQASSDSLIIEGEGSLLLPNGEIDLRFNSRGRGRIPILDDILRGLRNEIVTTAVTGTIRDPDYRLEAFPSTQRMLGSIFRGDPRPSESRPHHDQEEK